MFPISVLYIGLLPWRVAEVPDMGTVISQLTAVLEEEM